MVGRKASPKLEADGVQEQKTTSASTVSQEQESEALLAQIH